MGVLACSRKNCENIMCDRYSHNYGYICNECFEELVESGYATNIEIFMKSVKKSTNQKEVAQIIFDAEFKKHK